MQPLRTRVHACLTCCRDPTRICSDEKECPHEVALAIVVICLLLLAFHFVSARCDAGTWRGGVVTSDSARRKARAEPSTAWLRARAPGYTPGSVPTLPSGVWHGYYHQYGHGHMLMPYRFEVEVSACLLAHHDLWNHF